MLKKIVCLSLLSFVFLFSRAQLPTPASFLGYEPGARYTPHHKIVDYFKQMAAAAPAMMQWQQYGETYGHRPLYIAVISSPENMQKIAAIQANNVALANGNGQVANAVPIVWLSYNVHGNEPSSSEAAMVSLYELLTKPEAKTWLQNTVVIIDPSLNPDGRDRYVNWYNDVVGEKPNANIQSREHHEPWPGGRLNHYNFDLNRDWAWQTQKETQQRVKIYQQWMPEVHVDYHEQGIDNPYYFAPAAEPYHEVITPWQRQFQVLIGRNHAGYFDNKGWLYFTNEIFDLFYPAYGDTYPMFNGAIGMTYEQAGGPRGGLAAEKYDGDTLTLKDRIAHHNTTGLSTVETASKNAGKLVQEFAAYFKNATQGKVGEYKTYIIKNTNAANLLALKELLDKNKILYKQGQGSGSGFNYRTGKEESFSYKFPDLIISNAQPQAALVKALLEPRTNLKDTLTYDITAWSLPYAYGLEAYASKQILNLQNVVPVAVPVLTDQNAYGYIIPWEGVSSAKVVAALLQKGVRLRFAEKAFSSNGKTFAPGSIIILNSGNQNRVTDFFNMLNKITSDLKVPVSTVSSGMVETGVDFGSAAVHYLKAPKVMLVTGEGVNPNAAGEIWHFFEQELQYPVTLVNAADVAGISLRDYNVIILPDGRFPFLTSEEKAEDLHTWIQSGGRVVALENAVKQISRLKWSNLKLKSEPDEKEDSSFTSVQIYDQRERTSVSTGTPGAIYTVAADNTHPLMYGYPNYYYTLKINSDAYSFIKNGGWNVGYLKKDKPLAGYVGYKLTPQLQDAVLFAVQDEGAGAISFLTDDVLFRSFWENGKLMLCNAVFMVGQ